MIDCCFGGCGKKLCIGHIDVRWRYSILCCGRIYFYHHCKYNITDLGKVGSDGIVNSAD